MGDRQALRDVVLRVVVPSHRGRGRPAEVVVQHLTELFVAVQADVDERLVEAEDPLRSISSCGPLPLWILTTEVSSPNCSE